MVRVHQLNYLKTSEDCSSQLIVVKVFGHSPKIENKTKKSAFPTPVQYGVEYSSQSNKAMESNIRHKVWKGRSIAVFSPVQFSSATQSCLTLHDPMDHSTPGLLVHHKLLESTQTHLHWVVDAIQPSHPLSSPSPPALNPSQHQGLFKWVSSSHQVTKILEFQLQHQSFQWTSRTDLL